MTAIELVTYPCKCLESQVVAFDGFDVMVFSKSTVSVHLECDVLGDGPLAQSAYQQLSRILEDPFYGRGGEEPFAQLRHVHVGRHGG